MRLDQEQLLEKYAGVLVNGEMPIRGYRFLLDRASGVPGLPDLMIVEEDMFEGTTPDAILQQHPGKDVQFRPRSSLDGMVELSPCLVDRFSNRQFDFIAGGTK